MTLSHLRPLLRSNTPQGGTGSISFRRFASSDRRRRYAYLDTHSNYCRQRHAGGNAVGLQFVGGLAIVAGGASAVAMAYCEEGNPQQPLRDSSANNQA